MLNAETFLKHYQIVWWYRAGRPLTTQGAER